MNKLCLFEKVKVVDYI